MSIRRFIPTDPLYSTQWHLSLVGRLGATGPNFQGLERLWIDTNGSGIRYGIWDTGVQRTHWDLAANYDATAQISVSGRLNDGQPLSATSGHGTSVAGLIAAATNARGGIGIAFNASITGIRIFGGSDDINGNWSRYLSTLDALKNFDVTNHSYGGRPDFTVKQDVAKFEAASIFGRGGLGTLNVKSAGNDNIDGNGRAVDASRYTVTVAALDQYGQVTNYSSYGAHVLVSAPAGSITTDLLGNKTGYDGLLSGDYTNKFGGTSAAGPVTAGVIGLLLDVAPELGWRDIQDILAYSSIGTGSLYTNNTAEENAAWIWNGANNWNGGGAHFSEDYGYGMVNAYNGTRMAEVWKFFTETPQTSANELVVSTGPVVANLAINDRATTSFSFNVTQEISLEHVDITLNLNHSDLNDLRIRLVSPDGTELSLYDGSSGSTTATASGFNYSFGIDGLHGENSVGTWLIDIADKYRNNAGVLNSVTFNGYGSAVDANNTYHYTDEITWILGLDGQSARATLTDTNGGQDWIDAACLWRDLILCLNEGATSSVNGFDFLTIAAGTQIENAIGGDGNDLITGNALDNILAGMRGDDFLIGGDGFDTALFTGIQSDYSIQWVGDTTIIDSSIYGHDTLTGFEWLRFADTCIANVPPPPDTVGPLLLSSSPADNALNVATSAAITLTFNENVQAGDGFITLYAKDVVWREIPAASLVFSGTTATIRFESPLSSDTHYSVINHGAITDRSGNLFTGLSNLTDLDFTTQGATVIRGTNGVDKLVGTASDDRLYGLNNNDTLNAAAGNDLLDGGAGYDKMIGGIGDDVYIVDNTKDTVTEALNAGTDTVKTNLTTYALGANVENLVYTGTLNFKATGNGLANSIQGSSGNDQITGGAGQDRLQGGTGSDSFVYLATTDSLPGILRDSIIDFDTTRDIINLVAIDANSSSRGNQAFVLASSFTGIKGQLVINSMDGNSIIGGDTNGDQVADFEILVLGVSSLSATNFVL